MCACLCACVGACVCVRVCSEMGYRHCDAMTRKTRRLAKQTLIFDTKDMAFSDLMDPNNQKTMGYVSKISTYACV
jgi:hypothetical protein